MQYNKIKTKITWKISRNCSSTSDRIRLFLLRLISIYQLEINLYTGQFFNFFPSICRYSSGEEYVILKKWIWIFSEGISIAIIMIHLLLSNKYSQQCSYRKNVFYATNDSFIIGIPNEKIILVSNII